MLVFFRHQKKEFDFILLWLEPNGERDCEAWWQHRQSPQLGEHLQDRNRRSLEWRGLWWLRFAVAGRERTEIQNEMSLKKKINLTYKHNFSN